MCAIPAPRKSDWFRTISTPIAWQTYICLVFPPNEARRLAERFEVHFTPTDGYWLDVAEIEIGIFERGCIGKRLASVIELTRRVAALEAERNAAQASINWRFTADDARIKLA